MLHEPPTHFVCGCGSMMDPPHRIVVVPRLPLSPDGDPWQILLKSTVIGKHIHLTCVQSSPCCGFWYPLGFSFEHLCNDPLSSRYVPQSSKLEGKRGL